MATWNVLWGQILGNTNSNSTPVHAAGKPHAISNHSSEPVQFRFWAWHGKLWQQSWEGVGFPGGAFWKFVSTTFEIWHMTHACMHVIYSSIYLCRSLNLKHYFWSIHLVNMLGLTLGPIVSMSAHACMTQGYFPPFRPLSCRRSMFRSELKILRSYKFPVTANPKGSKADWPYISHTQKSQLQHGLFRFTRVHHTCVPRSLLQAIWRGSKSLSLSSILLFLLQGFLQCPQILGYKFFVGKNHGYQLPVPHTLYQHVWG